MLLSLARKMKASSTSIAHVMPRRPTCHVCVLRVYGAERLNGNAKLQAQCMSLSPRPAPRSNLIVLALQALDPPAPSLARQIIRPIGNRQTIVRFHTVVITTPELAPSHMTSPSAQNKPTQRTGNSNNHPASAPSRHHARPQADSAPVHRSYVRISPHSHPAALQRRTNCCPGSNTGRDTRRPTLPRQRRAPQRAALLCALWLRDHQRPRA